MFPVPKLFLAMLFLLLGISQAEITGTVLSPQGNPLAQVAIYQLGSQDTTWTDNSGAFTATVDENVVSLAPQFSTMKMQNNILQFSSEGGIPFKTELYSILGNNVSSYSGVTISGNQKINVFPENQIQEGTYLLKVQIGSQVSVYKVAQLGPQTNAIFNSTLARPLAIPKVLRFEKTGYQALDKNINNDSTNLGSIILALKTGNSQAATSSATNSSTIQLSSSSIIPNSSGTLLSSSSANLVSPPLALNLSINGTMSVGSMLTGSYTYFDEQGDAEGNTQKGWARNNQPISGPFSNSYIVKANDIGLPISFMVVPRAITGTILNGIPNAITLTPPVAQNVSISGSATKDSTITGSYTYFDTDSDAEATSRVRWLRNGIAISGATTNSYKVLASDSGKVLRFEVTPFAQTGINLQGLPTPADVTAEEGFSTPVAQSLSISGTATQDSTISGVYTFFDADGDLEGATSFQWYRDGNAIQGANTLSYQIQYADSGAVLRLDVTPKSLTGGKLIGAIATASTAKVTGFTVPIAQNATIAGTATQDSTIVARYTYFDAEGDAEGNTTFQWYRGGQTIAGATDSTYAIAKADSGQYLRVYIKVKALTGVNLGGQIVAQATTPKVTGFTAPVAQSASITGSHTVGSTLTANYTYFDAEGDTESNTSFRWVRDGAYIVGDTAQTHIVTKEDQEKTLTVHIIPRTATGYNLTGATVAVHLDIQRYFTDARDGKVYKAVTINNTTWMAQNLNYNSGTGSVCYNNSNGNCNTYGRLYSFAKAQTSCPVGWRLSSDGDWESMASYINQSKGGVGKDGVDRWRTVGTHLRSSSWVGGLDSYGFKVLPAGLGHNNGGFSSQGSEAIFWTSSVVSSGSTSYARSMIGNSLKAYLFRGAHSQVRNYPIRCIQERYYLTMVSNTGGTATPSSQSVASHDPIAIAATDTSANYVFDKWIISGSGTIANANLRNTTVTLTGNATVTATYFSKTFIDARDSKTYKKVKIGTQVWMGENLNYTPAPTTGTYCYNNTSSYCTTYGRLYEWAQANAVCPTGWHLPTDTEWETLAQYIATETGDNSKQNGGSTWLTLGKHLKKMPGWSSSPQNPPELDTYEFGAIGGGTRTSSFGDIGTKGYWWSSTESGGNAFYRQLSHNSNQFYRPTFTKTTAFSVRCMED